MKLFKEDDIIYVEGVDLSQVKCSRCGRRGFEGSFDGEKFYCLGCLYEMENSQTEVDVMDEREEKS